MVIIRILKLMLIKIKIIMLILRFLPPTGNNYKDNSRVARDRHKRN